jgi:glycosyltransferase involved in cell wall biosynthesis
MIPTLSIVVPAYNIAPYIEQCLHSILGQLKDHHELIVIDDGSKDTTRALAEQLRAGWPGTNFRVISQVNEGLAGVRNHGVRAATGEYIVWVDGDDVLVDGILALLDQAIGEQHPDAIACDFHMWHPQEPAKSHYEKLGYPANVLLRDQDAILNAFLATRKMYVWTNVIRRAIYAQLPDPIFPPGRVFEDISTTPRLLSQCASLLYLAKAIIDYRQHPASITQSISEKWCMDFASGLPVSRRHLHERGVSDSVKRHFDITAGHFFIGVYKSTYQLPGAAGKQVRASIRQSFIENLFGDCASMLATLERPETISFDRDCDRRMIRQVQHALSGNLLFHISQSASRKLKVLRQARKLRRYNASLANS